MVVVPLPVAMRRWRSVISRCLTIFLLAHLPAVQVSSQNEDRPVYTFSESRNSLRICPVVIPSANPSFAIRPSSSSDAFLNGEYSYPTLDDFRFSPSMTSCNDRSCTELSIRYNIDSPPTQVPGRFTVDYVGSDGRGQASIQIDYATKGLYLQNPGLGEVLRPVGGNESVLNQGILVYLGDLPPPFITCHVDNETEAQVVIAIDSGGYSECLPSIGDGDSGRPTFLELHYNPDLAVGQHRFYAAAEGNCSSQHRSKEFVVSFEDPIITTTDTEVTTTSDIGGTGGPGDNTGLIIGGVIGGVLFLLVLVVLVAVLVVVIGGVVYRHTHTNKRGKSPIENGEASPFFHGTTQTTKQNGTSNGHVDHPVRPSLQCIYIGGKHYKALDECLADCHEVEPRRLDDNNIDLVRAAVSRHECIVYIVQDSGLEDESSAFVTELESMPSNEKYKTNVFLLRFKSDEQKTIDDRTYYYMLMRQEDPCSDRFDASSCAKTIVDEVKSIRGEDRQQESTESSEHSRTRNFTDGKVVVHVQTMNFNVTSDQQGDDKGTLKEIMKVVTEVGGKVDEVGGKVDKVGGKVDDTKTTLQGGLKDMQDDLGVIEEHLNKLPDGRNKTVIDPCDPA